jgi:predicted NBD/HSP70 family sugar kinase
VLPASGTTPQVMRALNQRTVFECLRSSGRASRAEIAQMTNLSKPTVSLAVGDLERAGLVRLAGHRPPSGFGKPSIIFEPDPTAGYVLGIDVGRRWVRAGIADLNGHGLARYDMANTSRGATDLIAMVAGAAATVRETAELTPDRIVTTVVGGPGVLDEKRRRFVYAPRLPGWSSPGILDALEESIGSQVRFDNDVALATVAEAAQGAARDRPNFVYLWIGTGVGLGLWLDGRLYRGASGSAGEVGFLPMGLATGMDNLQLAAVERRQGLIERNIGAAGIVRFARQSGLRQVHDVKTLFDLARTGDALAVTVMGQVERRLAHLIATVVALVDPGLIVLGGAIGRNLVTDSASLLDEFAHMSPLKPRLANAHFGDEAVVVGAITSALDHAQDTIFAERMSTLSAIA